MQIEEMTLEQVTSRVSELLNKTQNGGVSPAERRELESLQAVRSQTLKAKQSRDRAFQEYRKAVRPEVERLSNARQHFSAAATAVTKQGLNNVGDYDSNFLRVQQKLEQELRQPMTVENIVRVLSDGSLEGLAPNPNADQLHQERDQQEKAQLIEEIVEDYSFDEHARSVYRMKLEKPDVTLEALRQRAQAIRERNRLYQLSPGQIRAENAAKRDQQTQPETAKPIHIAAEVRALNTQYPQMPAEAWIDGKEVVLDSKYIRRCNGDQLKHLIKLYGDQQVVNRLRQIS
jgi:hypothetical protein